MTRLELAVQTVKESVSAFDVGQALGLEIRHGRCQCPIHGGKDFNCVLYRGSRGYYCHVCKAGGDSISLVQKTNGLGFKEAVAWINATFHIGLDLNSPMNPSEAKKAEIALKRRKNAIEFEDWKRRIRFDLALTADDIVRKLEEQRDVNRPHSYGEEWSDLFCQAVLLLPEARQFAEDAISECMEVKI